MNHRRVVALAGACLLTLPPALPAQTAISVGFGENADATTGVTSGPAITLALSRILGVGGLAAAVGLPTQAQDGNRWGSATGWLDLPDLGAGIGLLGSAQAFGYRDPLLDATGGAMAGEAQLYRPFSTGPVTVRLRAGARAGVLAGDAVTVRRALGGGGADVTYGAGPVIVRAGADLWAAQEAVYPEISAVAVASTAALTVHGRVSRWLHDDVPGTGWAVGAEIGLTDRLALIGGASEPATDILFFTPPQRSWSIGLRYGATPIRRESIPVPVITAPGRPIRLAVEAPAGGGPVLLAGTFNAWQPTPMRRAGDRWVAELRLEPGIYEYAFVAADGSWFVPEGTPGRKPDGFGGFVATIVVR